MCCVTNNFKHRLLWRSKTWSLWWNSSSNTQEQISLKLQNVIASDFKTVWTEVCRCGDTDITYRLWGSWLRWTQDSGGHIDRTQLLHTISQICEPLHRPLWWKNHNKYMLFLPWPVAGELYIWALYKRSAITCGIIYILMQNNLLRCTAQAEASYKA